MKHTPVLVGIQVGTTRTMVDTLGEASKSWQSSYVKEPKSEAWVGKINLSGDSQTNVPNHGGVNRVILGYAEEHYSAWKAELRVELPYGAFAENFTISGMSEANACVGDIYEIGNSIIQISEPRIPCWKISNRWGIEDLLQRVIDTGRTGWFFRTLQEGNIEQGQSMILVDRPYPKMTIAEINDVLVNRKNDKDAASEMANCTLLSERIREMFYARFGSGR